MGTPEKKFVVQKHTNPSGIHWDLMLAFGDVLWTWRLGIKPEQVQNTPVPTERIHDHPPRFLTYEGPVQNNTGTVKIADMGTFVILEQTEQKIAFETTGQILNGKFVLSKKEKELWLLTRLQ